MLFESNLPLILCSTFSNFIFHMPFSDDDSVVNVENLSNLYQKNIIKNTFNTSAASVIIEAFCPIMKMMCVHAIKSFFFEHIHSWMRWKVQNVKQCSFDPATPFSDFFLLSFFSSLTILCTFSMPHMFPCISSSFFWTFSQDFSSQIFLFARKKRLFTWIHAKLLKDDRLGEWVNGGKNWNKMRWRLIFVSSWIIILVVFI